MIISFKKKKKTNFVGPTNSELSHKKNSLSLSLSLSLSPFFYLMLRFDEICLYQWFSNGDLGGFLFFPMDYDLQCGDLG